MITGVATQVKSPDQSPGGEAHIFPCHQELKRNRSLKGGGGGGPGGGKMGEKRAHCGTRGSHPGQES